MSRKKTKKQLKEFARTPSMTLLRIFFAMWLKRSLNVLAAKICQDQARQLLRNANLVQKYFVAIVELIDLTNVLMVASVIQK